MIEKRKKTHLQNVSQTWTNYLPVPFGSFLKVFLRARCINRLQKHPLGRTLTLPPRMTLERGR